ncbi:MAG: phosphonoacetaldehyde reductase [Clostridiales bacterium]|nr:phosphonoacetaldehyde reductase [Clostridiales bacterium]
MIQKVIRGRDSIGKVSALMEKVGIRKPLIVGSEKLTGRLTRQEALRNAPVFSGYHPNPDLADAETGVEIYGREGCDGLISLGGGSAMDTAKAIKAWLCAGSLENTRKNLLQERSIPHIAIPGTAGSGAEATSNAVLYEDGRKLSLGHPGLLPDGVILDAGLLDSLPEYHKKSCALDALSQGIESYWARSATEDSRVNAFLAILGVLDNLKAYLAGDPHAAQEVMDAAYQSGKAIFQTRTTAAHAMSYQITKLLGPAHGHACLITLPVLWDRMCADPDQRELMKELASRMRLGDPLMGSRLMRGMLIDLGMEAPPAPSEEILRKLVDSVNPERLGNHPQTLGSAEIEAVYRQAFRPVLDPERQACLDIWRYYGA